MMRHWSGTLTAKHYASLLQECVLRAFALGELWQRLAYDQRLEMFSLLMRCKSVFFLEDFIEEEFRRLRQRLVNLEGLYTRLFLRLGQKVTDDFHQRID